VQTANNQFVDAFLKENIDKLVTFYTADAVCMPDYQSSMKGVGAIKEYYQQIFGRMQVTSFSKKTMETISIRNNVIEIGTFSLSYSGETTNPAVTLNGKYFNIWTLQQNGLLKLKAESYGYFHAVENPKILVAKTTSTSDENSAKPKTKATSNLHFELDALNTLMEKSVRTRDGNLRADFFTHDAIFMPFADSMKTGMVKIRNHLLEYNSGNVIIDSISIYNTYVEDLGSFVIEYPRFYVKWRYAENSGTGQGKGIRLWKRGADCSLKLYREIGLHDHVE
jgi:ketosteroid isomerase-like protein